MKGMKNKYKILIVIASVFLVFFGIYKYKVMTPRYVDIGTKEKFSTNKEGVFVETEGKGLLTRRRKVYVKDLSAPVIKLKGAKKAHVCPKHKYQEEGYEVIDNYDKNPKVSVIKQKDKIIYKSVDKAGNSSKVVRHIEYSDHEKPVVKLNSLQVKLGNNLDYKVIDNCDGDITANSEIIFDNSTAGEQLVKINAKDSSGNESNFEEKVYVYKNKKVGVIYLTYDDGPKHATTSRLLDILKRENVKASFFVIGTDASSLIKRAYDEGHAIGIHTFSHKYHEVYQDMDSFKKDFKKIDDLIFKMTGTRTKLYRFPGGSSNLISKKYKIGIVSEIVDFLNKNNYVYFDWNIDSGDGGSIKPSSDEMLRRIVSNLSRDRDNVILLHDIYDETVTASEKLIKYAKNNDFIFEKVDISRGIVHHKINN